MPQKQVQKITDITTVSLTLMSAAIGLDLVQTIYHLATRPITLLETFSNWLVIGGALGGAFLGAFIALLAHLYPKPISKTKLCCVALLIPLYTTMSTLRTWLEISDTPLSNVLGLIGVVVLCYEMRSINKIYPEG
jgi:hypothetical protein